MARVVLTPEARRAVDRLNNPILARVLAIAERLGDWPNVSGAKPLRAGLAGRYRVRTGDYRVQFRVDGDTVVIEKVGKRDRFYED
ncbi:MAG TPA: type II toxin-antitoxin system RelE/ParE family toxin [Tepidisphaeraceae bacterium]|nr:type II toxin-antitoxin system RelE/ParE family toxin [Tepidisphaeraceae bacterium]